MLFNNQTKNHALTTKPPLKGDLQIDLILKGDQE